MTIEDLVDQYGTDKNISLYTPTYEKLFNPLKNSVTNLLEIGIGTLNPEHPSSFSGIVGFNPQYKQGGSLRVWRDFFPNANIYGVDIAEDCMFEEDRIKTFLFDSSDQIQSHYQLKGLEFDIIIDDGNHHPEYQVKTLRNLWPQLKPKGVYFIEDVGGQPGNDGQSDLLIQYLSEVEEIIGDCYVLNKGNHVVIIKSTKEECELNFKDETKPSSQKDYTIVTGLWNLSRDGRGFEDHYLPNFKNMLQIDAPMVIFVPKELEGFVRENRGEKKTYVRIMELEDLKLLYQPFWDKTQNLRNDPDWLNVTGEGGWLKTSPQATLEYYNPIVQSKMFMLNDSVCWNPFDTDYFFWLDAGITNTVSKEDLVDNNVLDVLPSLGNPFLFLSYPYESYEIHGFKTEGIEKIIGKKTEYVCRGGLFGGHKDQIRETNGNYYHLLMECFDRGYMGTEETIFTLLSYKEPHVYKRIDIGASGLIQNFINSVKEGTLEITKEESPINISYEKITDKNVDALKTHLYILTFNFPEQLEHTIASMKKTPEWLEKPKLFLLDNSTDANAKLSYREICKLEGFEYIDLEGNRGINGGRQLAAQHFGESDADFMFFFEDDMTSNPPELQGQFCRNGLRKYIPNLYNIVHKIMLKEKFDFLKLSFTEVYLDNNTQTSWYNVPQSVRDSDWPHYPTLPTMGLDPNTPLTKFNNINVLDGVAYIDGEIYYSNWPMIVSKEGNQKMFLDTTWANPYEQTWMSYMYQKTKKGKLKPAVLLASPIWHDRIKHYGANERREN